MSLAISCRRAGLLVAAFALVASVASAQITSKLVACGGLGTFGCQGTSNPPTLTNGVPASGTVEFIYDAALSQLTLVVNNTTPVTSTPNPFITRIFFNLPQFAVTGCTLLSQTAASGVPQFSLTADFDLSDGSPNNATCAGNFSCRLQATTGSLGSIVAPGATNFLPVQPTVGPVTFVMQLSGPNTQYLSADTFSRLLSTGPTPANACLRFLGGGSTADEAGNLANTATCSAAGWFTGTPTLGSQLLFTMNGRPGCYGCLVGSFNPGPTFVQDLGITVPIGTPFAEIVGGGFPAFNGQNYVSNTLVIPNVASIQGLTVYCAVVLVKVGGTIEYSITDQFQFTIL